MLINQLKGVKLKMSGDKDRSCENQNGALKGKGRKTDERKTRVWCIGSWIIRLSNRTEFCSPVALFLRAEQVQLGLRTGVDSVVVKGKNPCLRRESNTVVPLRGLALAYSVHCGNVGCKYLCGHLI